MAQMNKANLSPKKHLFGLSGKQKWKPSSKVKK